MTEPHPNEAQPPGRPGGRHPAAATGKAHADLRTSFVQRHRSGFLLSTVVLLLALLGLAFSPPATATAASNDLNAGAGPVPRASAGLGGGVLVAPSSGDRETRPPLPPPGLRSDPEEKPASRTPPVDTRPTAPTLPSPPPISLLPNEAERKVRVPNLIEKTLREADRMLRDARLVRERTTGRGSDAPADALVLRQIPQAGTLVPPGSGVQVFVRSPERGAEPLPNVGPPLRVAVPRLLGMPVETARERAERGRLRLVVSDRTASERRPNSVIAQDPAADTLVMPGSQVRVTLAVPAPARVPVPALVGGTLGEARAVLARSRLRLAARQSSEAGDESQTVVKQDPQPGQMVAPGASVSVETARVPPRVNVPDLGGKSLGAADAILAAAKLRRGRVTTARQSSLPEGTIVGQTPAPRIPVTPDSAIDVVVAPATAVVPHTDPQPTIAPPAPPTTAPTSSNDKAEERTPPGNGGPDGTRTLLAVTILCVAVAGGLLLRARRSTPEPAAQAVRVVVDPVLPRITMQFTGPAGAGIVIQTLPGTATLTVQANGPLGEPEEGGKDDA